MTPTTIEIAKGFGLDLDVVTEASAIVATRGAGKSSTSAVVVEEILPLGVQAVVLDRTGVYWGLRSSRDGRRPGLGIYVLGGAHGDVPLESGAGALVADLIVDSGHSFVLDFSDFSKGQTIRFAADLLERVYDRKARSRTTTLLVVDEAHFYAPQSPRGGFKGDAARLMGAMEDVVGLGRSRGLGVVLTTQRTQSLNKAILDLIDTLIVMRMLSPRARQAVRDWLMEKHEDDEQGVIKTLDGLQDGEAWVWSPVRAVLVKIHVRRIRTFDSYATPRVGQTRAEPTARRELDLDALGEQMRATAERQRENDPSELKRRIRELEARPADDPRLRADLDAALARVAELEARPAVTDDDRATLAEIAARVGEGQQAVASAYAALTEALRVLPLDAAPAPARVPAPTPAARPAAPRAPRGATTSNGALTRRAERMVLAVLAQYPDGRTKRQTAILAGYAVKGGGFTGALSKLRTLGYIEGSDPLRATQSGLAAIEGQYEPLPTGRALLDHWLASLKRRAEREVLQVLYDASGGALPADVVAERAGYAATGGGFTGALSKLRTLELIEGGRDALRVAEALLGA